jgi:hypothetical protein
MPITRLSSGGTFTFTATSGSTNAISFIGGTETPFNYVFRNGIVTGITNLNSASNGAYGIKDLTSLNNQAELHNNGTYRYGLKSIATGSWDVSNNNIDKSKLIQNGSLFIVDGDQTTTITLPHTAPDLNGTIVKVIKVNSDIYELTIKTKGTAGNEIIGANISGSANSTQGKQIYTFRQFSAIELMHSGSNWIVTSYTGAWSIIP